MAYSANGLFRFSDGGILGSGAGSVKGLCHYVTNDVAGTVEAAGYFNAAASFLTVGSLIFASLDLDGTPAFKAYMVTANSGSAVTIAAQTAS